MTAAENIAAVRENVAHIARGCRSGLSHNPAVHEQVIAAALDALAADLEAQRAEIESWKATAETLGDEGAMGDLLATAEVRVETLTRERDEREAGAQWQYEMGKAWKNRADAAEVREAQLREALERAEEMCARGPACGAVIREALVVQPPDTREPRCTTCGHVPPNPRCELCCEEPPDTREPRTMVESLEAAGMLHDPDTREPEEVNEPDETKDAGLTMQQSARAVGGDGTEPDKADTSPPSGSLTSPAGGAPGGVARSGDAE